MSRRRVVIQPLAYSSEPLFEVFDASSVPLGSLRESVSLGRSPDRSRGSTMVVYRIRKRNYSVFMEWGAISRTQFSASRLDAMFRSSIRMLSGFSSGFSACGLLGRDQEMIRAFGFLRGASFPRGVPAR